MQRKPKVRSRVSIALVVTAGLLLPEPGVAQATRSAQTACAGEANRNGYQVLRTGNFRQIPDGWQLELTLRNAQGRTDDGTCTVRTSTGQVSFSGFDFGGGGGGGGSGGMRFDCASDGYKYRECQLPVDGRARLVRQYSNDKGPCREGDSWGQRGDRVWVDRGCRAQFEVVRGESGGGQYFDCRSTDGRYRECKIQGGRDAQLVRTYTSSCRKDSTWGVRPGVVWVTSGCQAQFRAIGGAGGGGGGPSVIQQRAEASCRAEAQRQFIAVLNITPARSQGSYWQATVHGKLRGHPVAADCRYDPKSNRSSLFIDQDGGPGGGGNTDLKSRAETACMAHAKRVGYQVVGQRAASPVQNGLTVGLQLKQGNAIYQTSCFYETRSGQTRLDQVRPQPR
jgi:hypothetical protein